MRKMFIHFVGVVITAIWIAPATMAQEPLKYDELPRFHRINEKLYRGAQPRRGGLMRLKQIGVKTVINLRGANEDTRAEELEARAMGLNYFNVPIGRFGRPSDAQVKRAIAIIDAAENQPVFVHCNHGRDRTGLVVAIYRLEYDRWTDEEALREARNRGMFFWKFGLKAYVRDYYKRMREHGRPVTKIKSTWELAPEVTYFVKKLQPAKVESGPG